MVDQSDGRILIAAASVLMDYPSTPDLPALPAFEACDPSGFIWKTMEGRHIR
jgi:hypothetical protein